MNEKDWNNLQATLDHVERVRDFLHSFVGELLRRGREHDRSKFSREEFNAFKETLPKLGEAEYGSKEYEQLLEDLNETLDHHYEQNDHHPEYHENGIEDMDLFSIVEMLCDWRAATERSPDGDIHESIEQNQDRFGYTDEMKSILHNTADRLERIQ